MLSGSYRSINHCCIQLGSSVLLYLTTYYFQLHHCVSTDNSCTVQKSKYILHTLYTVKSSTLKISLNSTNKCPWVLNFVFIILLQILQYRRFSHKLCNFYLQIKGKLNPTTGHELQEAEQRYSSILPLTSALDEGGWGRVINATPRPLYPRICCMDFEKQSKYVPNFTKLQLSPNHPHYKRDIYGQNINLSDVIPLCYS